MDLEERIAQIDPGVLVALHRGLKAGKHRVGRDGHLPDLVVAVLGDRLHVSADHHRQVVRSERSQTGFEAADAGVGQRR